MKIVQSLVLLSSLFAASAYAQSAVQENDHQTDQIKIEQNKVCSEDGKIKLSGDQQDVLIKHLIKYDI